MRTGTKKCKVKVHVVWCGSSIYKIYRKKISAQKAVTRLRSSYRTLMGSYRKETFTLV